MALRIAALKERAPGEHRVALTPETAKKFAALGAVVAVEEGAGLAAAITDQAYRDAGAEVLTGPQAVAEADIVLGVNVLPEFSRKRTYHNMFDVALGTFDLLALPSTDRGGRAADLTVVPPVGNLNPSDMSRVEETVARSRRHAPRAARAQATPRSLRRGSPAEKALAVSSKS